MKQKGNKTFRHSDHNEVKQFKGKKGIASNFAKGFENPKKWYEELPEDPPNCPKVSEEKLVELKDEAKKCNDAEVATYSIKNSKTNTDYQWMKTVMSKGTISDKIAAYTVLIQDDSVCNLATLRNLINMVKVGKKKECLIVMDTLAELFLSDLLRPDMKLKPFHERPLSKLDELSSGNSASRRKFLSIWYFEDQLKECYTSFVQALNTAAHDSVEANKEKAIAAMHKLLEGNPEQEKNLLTNIINKLGDPSQKVASKAIYCLGQVLYQHPNMKQVVLNEIERLLFRPNVSTKAQYYGICFLSQYALSHEDYEVAKNLIAIYFAFFKACIKKGEVDTRMMSALLMGVNRAYPYAQSELTKISDHINTMYKVVHVATFNVALHAMNLLYQVSEHNDTVNDRFYSALYKKLIDPQIGTTKHQALFLNLVFRALKRDNNANRVRAFIKRLLQVAVYMQPSMTCAILFLIYQLMRKRKNLLALKSKATEAIANDDDDKPEHYDDAKVEEEIEIKDETEDSDKEVEIAKDPNLIINLSKIEPVEAKPDIDVLNSSLDLKGSWYHADRAIKSEFSHPEITCYNPNQRNPLYAGGEFCVYVELLNLQKHFHPTVSLYANKIMNEEHIQYSGDPLQDFTLVRFLERFSFKNPKKIEEVQKPGINPIFGRRKLSVPKGIKSHNVNSKNYLNLNQKKIPVEELFMHTYLLRKHRERKLAKEDEDDDSDLESVASDEFEAMLDNMSAGKKLDDEDLDFMNDVSETMKNKTKKGKKTEEDESDDDEIEDEDDDAEFSDQENDFGDEDIDDVDYNEEGFEDGGEDDFNEDDDNFDDLDDEDDDQSEIEFDSDSDGEATNVKTKGKSKKQQDAKKGKKKNDFNSIFASADEFASMLDEDDKFNAGTSNAVSNKDNANVKQLSWEQNRHRWVKGYDKAVGKKGGKNFSHKNKNFSKKRQKNSQPGNKNKKQKKH